MPVQKGKEKEKEVLPGVIVTFGKGSVVVDREESIAEQEFQVEV